MYKNSLILGSIITASLIFTGCGGSSSSDANSTALEPTSNNNNIQDEQKDTTPPNFTGSNSFEVDEDQTLIEAISVDESNVTFSKKSGSDNSTLFTISEIGVLTFNAPLVDKDKNYTISIIAKDLSNNENSQDITITVKDLNASFISTDKLTITENLLLKHRLLVANMENVIFSKDENSDNSSDFNITTDGILEYRAPAVDSDRDYDIKVIADDSKNKISQTITVTVKEAGSTTNRAIMPIDTTGLFERDDIGIVKNTLTGFIWEDTIFNENNVTFAEAKAHCEELTLNGIDSWRLPTRADLFKIADYYNKSENSNFIGSEFENIASGYYWSSEEEGDKAWGVAYNGGIGDKRVEKDSSKARVRCVSGSHQPPRFTGTHMSQTRVDLDTNLEWQSHVVNDNGQYHYDQNWSQTKQTCESAGFRLPTINELRSIVEYESGKVFGDLTVTVGEETDSARSELNGLNGRVWTSTEMPDGKIKALYIAKDSGSNVSAIIKDSIYDAYIDKNESGYNIKGVCVKERKRLIDTLYLK